MNCVMKEEEASPSPDLSDVFCMLTSESVTHLSYN